LVRLRATGSVPPVHPLFRLRRQSGELRGHSELLLDRVGVAEGWRVIDQAALADIGVAAQADIYPAGNSRRTVRADLVRSMRPKILAAGIATERELDEVDHAVRQHLRLDLVYLRIGGRSEGSGESVGERFEALAGLSDERLIRHLGVSDIDRAQLDEARAIAPVAAVQNHFHVHRQQDPGLLNDCEANESGFVPFFPLGGGTDRLDAARLEPIAKRHEATIRQVALAYLLARSPVMLAIPGTGSLGHLEENMAASRISLTAEDMAELG
jgi:diketogulonate reductase-like aldo/keto reductase